MSVLLFLIISGLDTRVANYISFKLSKHNKKRSLIYNTLECSSDEADISFVEHAFG